MVMLKHILGIGLDFPLQDFITRAPHTINHYNSGSVSPPSNNSLGVKELGIFITKLTYFSLYL